MPLTRCRLLELSDELHLLLFELRDARLVVPLLHGVVYLADRVRAAHVNLLVHQMQIVLLLRLVALDELLKLVDFPLLEQSILP